MWPYILVLAVLKPTPCQGVKTVDVRGTHGTTPVPLPTGLDEDVANNEPIADWDTSNVKSMRYVWVLPWHLLPSGGVFMN
jgi:hypothetical protein